MRIVEISVDSHVFFNLHQGANLFGKARGRDGAAREEAAYPHAACFDDPKR